MICWLSTKPFKDLSVLLQSLPQRVESLKLVWSCSALRIVNRGWFVEKEDDDHGGRKVQSHSDRVAESCHGPHCWFESKWVPSRNPQKLVMSISKTENWGYPKLMVSEAVVTPKWHRKKLGSSVIVNVKNTHISSLLGLFVHHFATQKTLLVDVGGRTSHADGGNEVVKPFVGFC